MPEIQERTFLVIDDLSPNQLAELYGAAKLVIATRFHAVVLAITGGTPVIAIPYFGVKTQGSLSDLGLSEYVIELADLTLPVLQAKAESILSFGEVGRQKIRGIADKQYAAAMQTGARVRNSLDMQSV